MILLSDLKYHNEFQNLKQYFLKQNNYFRDFLMTPSPLKFLKEHLITKNFDTLILLKQEKQIDMA